MKVDCLSIIGVGLIGGSIGLAAKLKSAVRHVVGVGRDERTLARAQALGAVDTFTTDLTHGVRDADLVVVCTPVDRVAQDVLACARAAPKRAVITDAGSTKGNIIHALSGQLSQATAPFVGSHPLAGSEKKGAAHARADLFENRLVIITPTAETDPEAIGMVELFWQWLGAQVCRMNPHDHDQALAYTSHLPHAVAAALAGVTPTGWLGLTAGGFRDTTRIAAGDPQLWQAIFQANRDALLQAVQEFQARMANFRTALENNDADALIHWLAEGKKVRDALGS